MNRINISVVICTRDREDKLKRCLASIARSTLQPVEVVVVDQSSNGKTKHVVNEYSRIMPAPLKYLRLDSVGHTRARNAGIHACSGDIVAFTDDDCIVDECWLEALSWEFTSARVSCVCVRHGRQIITIVRSLH
jgi:glycosyltransferase involved in cell wall biosynthesis